MWWAMLSVGALGVLVGAAQLVRTFRGGLSDRNLAKTEPTEHLVRPAVFVTFGLFLAFFALANPIASRLATS
ncbi:MAG: hypothetical protein P1P87_03805 [Trueperaceae bacterium]|nr:hypothetical protein [Trueperaceae bacterium]